MISHLGVNFTDEKLLELMIKVSDILYKSRNIPLYILKYVMITLGINFTDEELIEMMIEVSDNLFFTCFVPLCFVSGFKGTVQRKLTGVLSGINQKLMICHCSDGYSFFNLKGLRSLKCKNVISALTGTLL
jgi:hypothetical protein